MASEPNGKTRRATGWTKNNVGSRWEWFGISTTSRDSEIWEIRWTPSLLPRCRSSAPASHRHLVPRWCISANLRSLVLPLSFLPASPLVFPFPPIHPLPPCLSRLEGYPPVPPPPQSLSFWILGTRRRCVEGQGGAKYTWAFWTTLSTRSNRADPLFGGHDVYIYIHVYALVCSVPVSEFWHPVSH